MELLDQFRGSESDKPKIEYQLAETYVVITGTREVRLDAFDSVEETDWETSAATVAVGVRGGRDQTARRTACFDSPRSDDSFAITSTDDGRLQSLTFNSVGSGARVVAAATTVIAYVGGLAAAAVGGAGSVARTAAAAVRMGFAPADAGGEVPATPEGKAVKAWTELHGVEATHRETYEGLLAEANAQLLATRQELVRAGDAAVERAAASRIARLERVAQACQAEIARVDALYKAWRSRTITRRTETLSFELGIGELERGPVPMIPPEGSQCFEAWKGLGVLVQVEYASAAVRSDDVKLDGANVVCWRIPRPAVFRVWRRGGDGAPRLERVNAALVVDPSSALGWIQLDDRLFGERSGTLEFGPMGVPSKLTEAEKSALGAVADALRAVPETAAAALENAVKTESSATGLLDARAQHRLDALKRDIEASKAELDLKGLAATADDYAKLKRLEQEVSIAEAEGRLAPASDLDLAKHDLELAEAREGLRRLNAGLPADGSALEDELADLVERVDALETRGGGHRRR